MGCSIRTRQCLFTVLLGFRFLKVSNTVREAETDSPSVSRFATSFHPARSPPPTSPEERVLRPPSSSSILAARSSECQRTFNSSSPTRREQNGTPSQRPLPHHRDGEQACTTHSPYPSAIFMACSSCCLCTELQKHNPGSAPSAMAPRCAQGMGGGCHAPPWLQTPPACCRLFSFVRKAPLVHRVHHPGRFLVLKYVGFFLPLFFLVPLSITLSVTS